MIDFDTVLRQPPDVAGRVCGICGRALDDEGVDVVQFWQASLLNEDEGYWLLYCGFCFDEELLEGVARG